MRLARKVARWQKVILRDLHRDCKFYERTSWYYNVNSQWELSKREVHLNRMDEPFESEAVCERELIWKPPNEFAADKNTDFCPDLSSSDDTYIRHDDVHPSLSDYQLMAVIIKDVIYFKISLSSGIIHPRGRWKIRIAAF